MKMASPICGESIRIILNYRRALKESTEDKESLLRVMKEDNHSEGSWTWTQRQSELIDEIGWEKWLNDRNAEGYSAFLARAQVGIAAY
jgi:hypothetical protein